MLAVRGLTKSFGGTFSVADVSFDVAAGECVGLVGPNGAGKTTVLNCLFGQLRPDSGTVTFEEHDLGRLPTWRRARLGMGRTYQRVEVFGELTVREHLVVALRAQRRGPELWRDLLGRSAPGAEELARVDGVLGTLALAEVADVPVAALGLGTCRLVELARAIVTEPRLLLADEPSSGLDEHETRELASTLRALQRARDMAVVLVEHDLSMVGAVVDRVLVMDLGTVVASGAFDDVMASPEVRRAYLGVT